MLLFAITLAITVAVACSVIKKKHLSTWFGMC
jgi:hypothetical protein